MLCSFSSAPARLLCPWKQEEAGVLPQVAAFARCPGMLLLSFKLLLVLSSAKAGGDGRYGGGCVYPPARASIDTRLARPRSDATRFLT